MCVQCLLGVKCQQQRTSDQWRVMTKPSSLNYNWLYELIHTHPHTNTHSMTPLSKYPLVRGLPVLVCVCVCETETGQVFDACHTDRNSGLTSCVGLGCWTKVFTWAVPWEKNWWTHTKRFPTQSRTGLCEGVCGRVWGSLRTHTHTHACDMKVLTSSSGSDLGGHTVPQVVYAGKTH